MLDIEMFAPLHDDPLLEVRLGRRKLQEREHGRRARGHDEILQLVLSDWQHLMILVLHVLDRAG